MSAAPYPFERLPRVARSEVAALRRWARALPIAALARSGAEASSWLGAPMRLTPGRPKITEAPVSAEPLTAVLVEHEGGRIGLTLDAPMTAALIERTLGGDEDAPAAAGPMGEIERGVLAYAIARWLGPSGWRVAAVFGYGPAMAEALGEGALVRLPIALELGEARGDAALWLPADAAPGPPVRALGGAGLPPWARLVPVTVTASAGEAVLDAGVFASLSPGDVVVPDRVSLDRSGAGGIELEVRGQPWRARARGAGARWTIEAVDRAAIVTRRGRRSGAVSEPIDSEASGNEAPLPRGEGGVEAMGSTPITLSLEVARFELPLADVVALAPGEVLSTGAAIGARVALRAGERVIATGELVDVEGEIGVRVLALG